MIKVTKMSLIEPRHPILPLDLIVEPAPIPEPTTCARSTDLKFPNERSELRFR